MIIRCLGTWTDRTHAPLQIGVKEPLSDERVSDSCCDACARAMGAALACRWCRKADTMDGLCAVCWLMLSARVGEPSITLTVYCQEGQISGNYDGAGAVLRLCAAMKEPNYRGFRMLALQEAA